MIYGAIVLCTAFMFWKLPTAFLPDDDQGYLYTNVQLPAGATQARTLEALKVVEDQFSKESGIEGIVTVVGHSFSGSAQNGGLAFVTLKDWGERDSDNSASEIVKRAAARFSQIRDAIVYPMNPPPIRELGNQTGFVFRLQDRADKGNAALILSLIHISEPTRPY